MFSTRWALWTQAGLLPWPGCTQVVVACPGTCHGIMLAPAQQQQVAQASASAQACLDIHTSHLSRPLHGYQQGTGQ
jgi:hypothetical protein